MTDGHEEAAARALEVLGASGEADVPLGPFTTYRAGGRAAVLAHLRGEDGLQTVARAVGASGLPVLIVGNGSNLLVADGGFAGIAVRLEQGFDQVEVDGTTVRAGGAALLPVVARLAVARGLRGFEWAVGVPGSIGGAVRMNAGGHGSDMAATLLGVRVFDLETGDDGVMEVASLDLGYRRSRLRPAHLVLRADIGLEPGSVAEGEAVLAEIVRWRRANQPGGSNAGSVFTNPVGDSAGRLIDAAGCKGLRIGSAEVSAKHANFIQVDVDGRADDVFALMCEIAGRVRAATGVDLEPETRLVGFEWGGEHRG